MQESSIPPLENLVWIQSRFKKSAVWTRQILGDGKDILVLCEKTEEKSNTAILNTIYIRLRIALYY